MKRKVKTLLIIFSAIFLLQTILVSCEKATNSSNVEQKKYYEGKSIEELVKMADYSVWEELYGSKTENLEKTNTANNNYYRFLSSDDVKGKYLGVSEAGGIDCLSDTTRCYTIIKAAIANPPKSVTENDNSIKEYILIYKENCPEFLQEK
ncbi:MAG: hypothetical protein LBV69_04580 [Bacteroidales bacterium]|jgi:hypothetical protein|nr:hypothetical protein [Bacteroidales bacterium]